MHENHQNLTDTNIVKFIKVSFEDNILFLKILSKNVTNRTLIYRKNMQKIAQDAAKLKNK